MRIGVDVGGTNTDLVLISDGEFRTHKLPSTPANPERAILQGLEELGINLRDVDLFAHGTTVATNAVIQRKGTPAGLLTTKGFRDVLQIRRTTRAKLYDFQWDPPQELVPRVWRREIVERTNGSGKMTVEPDISQALTSARELLEQGVKSLAICFINAYLNGENERRVRDAIHAVYPDLPVYISSEVLPEWREFERTSTTVVSAYSGPILADYIQDLKTKLWEKGYGYDLLIMLSNGGLASSDEAIALPGFALESGPAAGVLAQKIIGEAVGFENIIGMDIGGTSTDISIIREGQPFVKGETEVEFGTVIAYPVIDINSIGAGGSTIAWVDKGGMLNVGPESAGADPGPACQQTGGQEPTITDANVVLHRINPSFMLGGRIKISEGAAQEAIERIGQKLDLDTTRMAKGIIELSVANIASAIRQHTIERGLDPREFVLVAYGGAGPLSAIEVAQEIDVETVLVPPSPGLTSALGLLLTDIRHDFVSTYLHDASSVTAEDINPVYETLKNQGKTKLDAEGISPEHMSFVYAMDVRYIGQTHELTITLPCSSYDSRTHEMLPSLLHDNHLREFSYAPDLSAPIEIVNLRLTCLGLIDHPPLPEIAMGPLNQPKEYRSVYMQDDWFNTPVYDRALLRQGNFIKGPAVIEQLDSTTVILPNWFATVDRFGNVILKPA